MIEGPRHFLQAPVAELVVQASFIALSKGLHYNARHHEQE